MNDTVSLRLAAPDDADRMLLVIRSAFAARRPVHPPADALRDTLEDIRDALDRGRGVCVEVDGDLVACLLIGIAGDTATLRRVSVLPEYSGAGLAADMVSAAISVAADLGMSRVELLTRREFPELLAWWQGQGFKIERETDTGYILGRQLPVIIDVPTARDMQELGESLAGELQAGDVIIANGELGAGKTTLAQGIGAGLHVQGPVISPTFVLSRVHPAAGPGPDFVHVDAYRLGDPSELADIDLDQSLSCSVTMIEWGGGKAEWLSEERLDVTIERGTNSDDRVVWLDGIGPRWQGALDGFRKLR